MYHEFTRTDKPAACPTVKPVKWNPFNVPLTTLVKGRWVVQENNLSEKQLVANFIIDVYSVIMGYVEPIGTVCDIGEAFKCDDVNDLAQAFVSEIEDNPEYFKEYLRIMEKGLQKYWLRSWTKVDPYVLLQAALRHGSQMLWGMELDDEFGTRHFVHVIFNVCAMLDRREQEGCNLTHHCVVKLLEDIYSL